MTIFLNFDPPNVTNLSTDDNFVLHLIADGKSVVVDFKKLKVFERHPQLQNLQYFQTAVLRGSLVEWADDFHMDLDELVYELSTPDPPNPLETISYEEFRRLLQKTLVEDKLLYDMLEKEEFNAKSIFLVRKVTQIEITDYLKMMLWFDGDTQPRIVDFKQIIDTNPAFAALKDPDVFQNVKIMGSALRWEDQDIDIEAADLLESPKLVLSAKKSN